MEKINPLLVDIHVEQDGKIIASGDFSIKGNLVTINDVEYRVLDIDGTKIKVLSMDRNLKSEYGKNEKFSYSEYTGTKYEKSTLDKAMEEYYNSLPDILQNAIIEQNINRSMYKLSYDETDSNIADPKKEIPIGSVVRVEGGDLDCTKLGEINVGKRKVYALDLDDLVHYLGGTFHADDMMDMFFKDRAASFSNCT